MKLEVLNEIDPFRLRFVKTLFSLNSEVKDSGLSVNEFAELLEKPPESHMGDYALPCFQFAKKLRKAPQLIAKSFKDDLESANLDWIDRIEIKSAFLNIFLNKAVFTKALLPKVLDGSYLKLDEIVNANNSVRMMIEFSQPNTHKEFHVGHARNVCIGDSLCRIYKRLGHPLVAANYIGDEGTHVAKCLWQVKNNGGIPKGDANPAEWYGKCYVEANKVLSEASKSEREKYNDKISSILAELESKSGEFYDLWLLSRQQCLDEFKNIYSWLGVQFDHYFYESEVSEESQDIVDEYISKGLFKESEGAFGINLKDDDLGFFMARKSDGSTPYITKDLALARRKFFDFKIDKSIYVVGSEQNFHFQQLFRALDLMGFEQAKNCFHLSYALVKRPDGKMSSRLGNVLSFTFLREELLKELMPYFEKKNSEWSNSEVEKTADLLAIGAIRYGMLSQDPAKEITFDIKSWTSFEGNTGPYIMYSYVRTQSLLNKSKENGFKPSRDNLDLLDENIEWEILRHIYDYNQVVYNSGVNYKPSLIANHLFEMCKIYSRFYAEVPILRCSSDEKRSALLYLVESFAKIIFDGLSLLGISPPKRM